MEKLSIIKSVVAVGLEPQVVDVEVDVGAGLPGLTIVGLPDKAVEESKERVRLALKNSGFDFPQKKIVVNLAPADVKKEGPAYDLPIAVGTLIASGIIKPKEINKTIFIGELSLSGKLRATKGIIQASILAKKKNLSLVCPIQNQAEANLISGIEILAAEDLKSMVAALLADDTRIFSKTTGVKDVPEPDYGDYDFQNVVGQSQAKRALEIAAAGGHNVLLSGPPGGGKTLLSRSIISILPPLEEEELLEATKIYSVAGLLTEDEPIIIRRPFRSPHHTTSAVAIIGGGTYPKPGEISLANKGVLFLDEFPEFPRSVLEALRQPLEDKVVTVSRAQATYRFPADFILVAAKNPCPCGFLGDEHHECKCPATQILSYDRRVSGPLLDRIDLYLNVGKIPLKKIQSSQKEEKSSEVKKRVIKARRLQISRQGKLNSQLSKKDLNRFAALNEEQEEFLEGAAEKLGLSMRGFIKVLRISRTIADLAQSKNVLMEHLAEALQYRQREQ
ncbi:MAG: YifB family Mg chelatase-like AAA ATPase [Candidatus Berkelbacteria bacterium]|nr:YifB family Mg chelatase-like AAA ATPase [Candidatus Berkelbacteria bacterium]